MFIIILSLIPIYFKLILDFYSFMCYNAYINKKGEKLWILLDVKKEKEVFF